MTDWLGAEEREQKRRQATEKEKLKRDQLREDMAFVLSTTQGQRVLSNILEHCRATQSNFTGNSRTFALEGKREVGLSLMKWMAEAAPDASRKLIGELYVGRSDDA